MKKAAFCSSGKNQRVSMLGSCLALETDGERKHGEGGRLLPPCQGWLAPGCCSASSSSGLISRRPLVQLRATWRWGRAEGLGGREPMVSRSALFLPSGGGWRLRGGWQEEEGVCRGSRDGAGCSHLLEVKRDGENGGVLETAAHRREELEGTLEVSAGWCFVLLRVRSLLHQPLSVLIKLRG